MKKTLLLAVLFLVLGGGAWYALRTKNTQTTTFQSPDMEFAVRNTGDIGKIFIADRSNRTATLELKDGVWMYNGTWKARPTAVQTLLQTIENVTVLSTSTQAAQEHMGRGGGAPNGSQTVWAGEPSTNPYSQGGTTLPGQGHQTMTPCPTCRINQGRYL